MKWYFWVILAVAVAGIGYGIYTVVSTPKAVK